MHESKRAVIYARISQDRRGEGLGVQRQETECRTYAEREGMHVVDVLTDNDISGYSGKQRPGFMDLMRRVRDREIDAVIAWKQDRLTRQNLEFWQLVEMAKPVTGKADPGVTIHLPGDTGAGLLDLTTSHGLLTAGLGILLAQHESTVKRDRARSKVRQKARAGEWLGGTRPFGWSVDGRHLVVNDCEAKALLTAIRDVLNGQSLASVMRDWNDPDRPGGPLTTTLGKPWSYATLRQAMLRDRNVGRIEVDPKNGEPPIVVECPPIVPEMEHGAIQRLLTDKSRRRSQSNKARHLLAGIAQCHCGALLKSATVMERGGGKHTNYRCPAKGNGHVSKRIEYVDTVVELFVYKMVSQDARDRASDPERVAKRSQLEVQWRDMKQREADAGRLFAEGQMSAEQLAQVNRTIEAKLTALSDQIERMAAPTIEDLGDVSAVLNQEIDEAAFGAWRQSPVDNRRDFIRSRLHVVLMPHSAGSSRRFDTETVRVYPREFTERGRTLSADEVAALKPTPLVDPNTPDNGNDDPESSWLAYLEDFMHRSGIGWGAPFTGTPEWADSRAHFNPRWRDPVPR